MAQARQAGKDSCTGRPLPPLLGGSLPSGYTDSQTLSLWAAPPSASSVWICSGLQFTDHGAHRGSHGWALSCAAAAWSWGAPGSGGLLSSRLCACALAAWRGEGLFASFSSGGTRCFVAVSGKSAWALVSVTVKRGFKSQ